MRKAELEALLVEHKVPIERWGRGKAKTLEHLLSEVKSGEVVLKKRGGRLIRYLRVAALTVLYTDGENTLTLVEKEQVFADGRVRRRKFLGIGEKIPLGERPADAAYRALKEELKIMSKPPLRARRRYARAVKESGSYPGLLTRFVFFPFDVYLSHDDYRAEGYIERQKDKTTYFVWKKLETPR